MITNITSARPVRVTKISTKHTTISVGNGAGAISRVTSVNVGRAGKDGSNGSVQQINFSYGDAGPAILALAAANKLVYKVQLHIKTPFDGVGASLKVGDAASLDRLMKSTENDPALIGSNETNPAVGYAVDTPLLLSINAGAGATQGSGLITLYIQQ